MNFSNNYRSQFEGSQSVWYVGLKVKYPASRRKQSNARSRERSVLKKRFQVAKMAAKNYSQETLEAFHNVRIGGP